MMEYQLAPQISAVSRICVIGFLWACVPLIANPQEKAANGLSLPAELIAAEPEIRALLNYEDKPCKPGGFQGSADDLQKALQIAESRGLIGDRAIVEERLAAALMGEGKFEESFNIFQKALQDSIDTKNEVLEADILIALASEAQLKGNNPKAFELDSRALAISEKNANLYEKAHALGELGRLELISGKTAEAGIRIDEALKIDGLNGYRLESLHLLYRSYYLGLTGNDDKAIESLSEAKAKAISTRNAYVFVMAENAYAFGLVRKGKADEAIRELELVKKGELQTLIHEPKERECLTFSLELPLLRVLLLEGMSNAFEAANRPEEEIKVWREMLSISHELGLLAGEAEAEQKIADLESKLNRTDDAVKDYALAAGVYKSMQNEGQLNQVEIAEALLLVQLGRQKEALPVVKNVLAYAKSHDLRSLEFRADLELAEIYQPTGDLDQARDQLEAAVSLIRPGPFDSEIDDRATHEAYVRLSDIYRGLNIPQKELVSIDGAYFISAHAKDEKSQQSEVNYLDQRLNELHIRDLVGQRQKEGQLVESLIYSYILFVRDGFPSKPSDDQSNWKRILTLPFQIARQSAGPPALKEILHDIGPYVVPFNKLPILVALARYYNSDGGDPILAERYATESENILKDAKGDVSSLKEEPACILALSYARQNKIELAKDKLEECASLSSKVGDQQTTDYFDATNILVQAQLGNIAGAKKSLERVIAKTPDNPELNVELATSLASGKLYDEANSRLQVAVQKIISTGDKRLAATAYKRVAGALDKDPSEVAQKLQFKYLNSALQLYHSLAFQPEEAELLILLGDYYLKVVQIQAAIESYRGAIGIAQKIGKPEIEAEGLLGLGNGYKAQNDFNQAVEYHRKAAKAYHNLNYAQREALCLSDLGFDYYQLGDSDQAFTSLQEARTVAQHATSLNRYLVAYLLGDFYRSQGQFENAITSFNDAVQITTQSGDLEHLAYSHLAKATVDTVIGGWDDAVSEIQTALDIFRRIGNKEGQASCWEQLTEVYSDRSSSLKNFDKAQEYYAKAQEYGYGKSLQLDLIEIYIQTGRYADASKIARESLQDCLLDKNKECQAHALLSVSEAERLNGHLKESRSALNQARPIASTSQEVYLRGRLLYAEARLLVSEGKLDEALISYKKIISLIESIKGSLSPQEQKSIAENYSYIYDELVSLLYSMSRRTLDSQSAFASEAFEYAEVNKARQFAASWGRVFVNQMRLALPPATREREQSLYSKRDHLIAQLTVNGVEPNPEAARKELEANLSSVQGEINEFLTGLRRTAPQYAAIAYPDETQISTLPLKKTETLVELKMTDDSTFVWIIQNRDGTHNDLAAFYRVSKKRDWFLDRLSMLRNGLNSGRAGAVDWNIAEELFAEMFPGNVAKLVLDAPEIIFVPDDVFFILPLELLSPGASKGNFVFLKKATTYYPSAASLRLARTASHQSDWQEAFLGIADPITSPEDDRFEAAGAIKAPANIPSIQTQSSGGEQNSSDGDRLKARGFSFERLPGTAIEVQGIASLLKAKNETVEIRSGATATKNELLDTDLSKFRFVHFATHGVLPVDTGIKEPSLVLSYDGVALSHMFLSMSEIIGLKLHSESVVLSACNTGTGKISRAEGVMSLGRAFLAAGSSSVTVSLWQVSDDSTVVLMKKYYEGVLAGKRKSVALAEARYAVFQGGSKDPFFWAPFILIGE